jgi:hypothetical protein
MDSNSHDQRAVRRIRMRWLVSISTAAVASLPLPLAAQAIARPCAVLPAHAPVTATEIATNVATFANLAPPVARLDAGSRSDSVVVDLYAPEFVAIAPAAPALSGLPIAETLSTVAVVPAGPPVKSPAAARAEPSVAASRAGVAGPPQFAIPDRISVQCSS